MTSQDLSGWKRIEPILDQARDLPAADRAAYLLVACGADEVLRARVQRMLEAGEDPDSPLEHSLATVAGPLMAEFEDEGPGPWCRGVWIGLG